MALAVQVSSKGIPVHECAPAGPVTSLESDIDVTSIATIKSGASWFSNSTGSKRRSWLSFRSNSSCSDVSEANANLRRAASHKGWNRRSAIVGVMNPSHWDREYMKCVTFSKTKDHVRWTPLHYAAKKGFSNAAGQLIEDGVPVEARTMDDQTALHMACAEGHLDVVHALIKHDANIWAQDKEMRTPVTLATEKHHLDVAISIFKTDANKAHFAEEKSQLLTAAIFTGDKVHLRKLLASYCDPNITVGGPRPLRVAVEKAEAEVVSILLKHGANPSLKSADGALPLATAVMRRSTEIVRILISHGANPFTPSAHGKCSFKIALERGDKDIIRLLMELNPTQTVSPGEAYHQLSMLSLAVDCNNPDAVRLLLENGSDPSGREQDGSTPLIRAAFPDRLNILELLLQHGADVLRPDQKGILPIQNVIFRAARRVQSLRSGAGDLQAAIDYEKSSIDVLQLLIQYGADLHSADLQGKNLLHLSSEAGLKRTALFCLANRFEVNGSDRNGWAALHWAAYGGDVSTAQVLKLRGADTDLADVQGLTSLLVACKYSHNDVAVLLSSSSDLNHRDSSGRSALYYAAHSENLLLAEHLLKNGAMAFEQDYNPPSPPGTPSSTSASSAGSAYFTCATRASEICKLGSTFELRQSNRLPNPSNLKRLLGLGAPPNSYVSNTPLICLAAMNTSAESTEILIKFNVDVKMADRNGQTALHIAASRGRSEIVEALIAAGADPLARDTLNRTPEDVANRAGHADIAYTLTAAKQNIAQRATSVRIQRPNVRWLSAGGSESSELSKIGFHALPPQRRATVSTSQRSPQWKQYQDRNTTSSGILRNGSTKIEGRAR